jgi:hypothetical protein
MGLSDLYTMLRQTGPILGPVFLVIAFFLWRDWKRETLLQGRVTKLEDDHKNIILPLVQEYATVVAANTEAMSRLERVMDKCLFTQSREERCVLDRLLQDAAENRQGQ